MIDHEIPGNAADKTEKYRPNNERQQYRLEVPDQIHYPCIMPIDFRQNMFHTENTSPKPCSEGIDRDDRPGISNIYSNQCNKFIKSAYPGDKNAENSMQSQDRRYADKNTQPERDSDLAGRILYSDDLPYFIPEGQSADILPLSAAFFRLNYR